MSEINGNITGIRDSVLQEMRTLYDFPIGEDEFAPVELVEALCRFSHEFNREIAIYISRDGEVLDITVGVTDNVPLSAIRLRRSTQRLSCVRCLHTHPGGTAHLSLVDISALQTLMLDAMCAIGIDENGRVTGVSAAFLGDMEDGKYAPILTGIVSLKRLPQADWMQEIALADERVTQGLNQNQMDAPERALLVGIDTEKSLEELAALADSAGAVVVGSVLQKKQKPDTATFIGSGKAAELQLTAQSLNADVVIFDDELTGMQTRNLEQLINVKVIDRTTLILDIFAQRAKSGEGKLQVALAQLKYRSTRLIGQGLILSRLGGGIGTRGPGETKLEIDRRRIRDRIAELKKDLEQLQRQRDLRRKSRERNAIPVVALVGYTNTGKSTLLNRLTDANVFVENQLFATLDAVSRKVTPPDGGEFLLVDTVGFISKLPHDLVEAFRSTLEEAALADLLVIVNDASSPDMLLQHKVVEEVLESLDATHQPRLNVLNKCDIALPGQELENAICISAATGEGMERLVSAISDELRKAESAVDVLVPFSQYGILNDLRAKGRIVGEEHEETGTRVTVMLDQETLSILAGKYGAGIFLPKAQQIDG